MQADGYKIKMKSISRANSPLTNQQIYEVVVNSFVPTTWKLDEVVNLWRSVEE
jgi:hypothetical protein